MHTAGPARCALHRVNHVLTQSKTLLEIFRHLTTYLDVPAVLSILQHTIESRSTEIQ